MKILIVSDVLGKPNNGTSITTFNLIDSLKKRGHDVRVLCPDKDKADWPNYFVCPTMNFGIFNNYVKKNDVVIAKADMKIIEAALDGVDVVHCMLPFSLGKKVAHIADKRGLPITAGFHCQAENLMSHFGLMHNPLANHLTYRAFWNRLYHVVDCIHYPTEFIKLKFEKSVGPTNGYVISNGVKPFYHKINAEKPTELKDKFVILYTGRYCKEKMNGLLIKATSLSKYKDKIQLVLAGDGPLRPKLEKQAKKQLNIQPIFGFHPQEELLKIINYSDLYVHCAYAELESIACLEAIKCGLVPVVNNSKQAAPRFFALDKRNLFDKNDPKSLAKQIDYWIEHPTQKEEMKKQYEDFTSHFEFEHCMDRMEKMMKEAIEVRRYKIEHNLKNRIVYYKDPYNDDYAGTDNIETKKVDDDFVYVHHNKLWRATANILYRGIAQPLLFVLCKLKRGVRVKNKKALKKLKHTGYFLYGNHTTTFDAFIPQSMVTRRKKTYIVANPDSVSIKGVKNIVSMLGAIPVPSSPKSVKNFNAAIEKRVEEKRVIAIYPEAHIWPFFTGIRPFSEVSFQYPARLNKPVVAMCATYRKPKGKFQSKRRPFITITLSEPIYPLEGVSEKENMKYLHDQVYEFLKATSEKQEQASYINYVQDENSTRFEK